MPAHKCIAPLLCAAAWLSTAACPAQGEGLTAEFAVSDIIPAGDVWKFFRGRSEPSGGTLAWTQESFVDQAWESGLAGFGYSDDDDATTLTDMPGRYTTVYLRKLFMPDADDIQGELELIVDYDDGFAAFLNGVEIARSEAGPRSSPIAFDDAASRSHEAGDEEVFPVGSAAGLLVPGTNVLALVGLNSSIDSGDFSLHPRLRSRVALAQGCPGEHYLAGSTALLRGTAPTPQTARVLVGGEPALFDAQSGSWSLALAVPPISATVLVAAVDSVGSPVASLGLKVIRARALGGEVAPETTLGSSGGPVVVTGRVSIPVGVRLTIGAGCEVLLGPEAGLDVEGEIRAEGSPTSPIVFTRIPCGENWGSFEFEGAVGRSIFRFCEWSYGTGSPGCLTLTDSDLELESCAIRDIDGEGVHSTGGKSRIRRSLMERTNEALSLDSGDTVVEFCTVRDVLGDSDLIDSNGSTDPPVRFSYNVIHGTNDDGIDLDRGSAIIEGNIIYDCGDQAMSLVGAGNSVVRGNICFRNGNGLSVKDSHVVFAELNTFALNTITGVRAIEDTPGRQGGRVTLESSIVWGNGTQVLANSGGFVNVSFSAVHGVLLPGTGNIDLDPLFADPAMNDFRLTQGSPCIGTGKDGKDMGAIPFELLPLPPANLAAAELPAGGVLLGWRDASWVEDGYEVERSVDGGAFTLLAELSADAIVYIDETAEDGSAYLFRVRARNEAGFSAWAGPVEVRPSALAPEVTSVEPAEGPSAGGTTITIRGRNFEGDVTASLGGAPIADLVVVSGDELRGTTPGGPRGAAELTVSTPSGEDTLDAAFTYVDIYPRGDATADGLRDISDAITVLRFLFLRGSPPPCPDVADINRDGSIDISDPVFLLLHLFSGGSAPEPDEARCDGSD